MRTLKDILEKLKVDDINFDILPSKLQKKYNLVYNSRTNCYDCNGDIDMCDDLIEDDHFICNFGVVKGDFDCTFCENLETLKGAPKEVSGNFSCGYCINLKSLEGAPKEVGGNFNCSQCDSLKTLEGAPEKVGGDLFCNGCINLKSLEGAPKEVGGDFWCKNCIKLKDYNIDNIKIKGTLIK